MEMQLFFLFFFISNSHKRAHKYIIFVLSTVKKVCCMHFMKGQKGCCTFADRHSADIKRTIWCCDTAWRAVVQFGAVTHPHH